MAGSFFFQKQLPGKPMNKHPLRSFLDGLYLICGYIAAIFLLILITIIVAQMVARWSGNVFPGSTDYAGYCMAGASFFAMAYALNNGAHIRVTLLLGQLGRFRKFGEIWCFGLGAFFASYFAFYAIKATYWSYKLHDISQGQDATPVWIPQIAMAVGISILAICLIDHFIRIVVFGLTDIGEESIADHHTE
jgi:TRAP-type C4-dicarboxylate transport system permease small subunit